jgi:hypothetical protein
MYTYGKCSEPVSVDPFMAIEQAMNKLGSDLVQEATELK